MDFQHVLNIVGEDYKAAARHVDDADVKNLQEAINTAGKIVTFGVGREGLALKAFAMRLHHLGYKATPAFEMTTPPLGKNDLLLLSNGPGNFVTVEAMAKLAEEKGVTVVTFTYAPEAEVSTHSRIVIEQPTDELAQSGLYTSSQLAAAAAPGSAGLLGSTYEGALTLVLDTVALLLAAGRGTTDKQLRIAHTNLE
mmetsp:Transcript_5096/g.14629  ORF Transcript_5096/g.14629 Transcript_5096/m.14629 type:complete len:196 (-) Transcript_5096:1481-2068(-)